MITRIFGSQTYPGRLFLDDARQPTEELQQYDSQDAEEEDRVGKYKGLQTDLYTQVRLDRPTRTAVRGALYTSEFGLADLRFTGSIKGWLECKAIDHSSLVNKEIPDNSPTFSFLLLLAALQMIERIGGNKSTAKGKCSCESTKVMLNGSEGVQWHAWL